MVTTLASDTFTGTNGAAWGSTWALGQDNTGSLAQIQSNVGRITTGSAGSYAGQTSRKVNITNPADAVWLMKFRWPTGAECYPQVWMRASNDILDSQAGYAFELNRPAGIWAVSKYTSYSSTTLSSASFTYTSNTWYWVRCGVVGSAVKFKIWADGASEPGAWTYEVTDTTYASAGRCGLRVGPGNAGSAQFEVDEFALTDAYALAFSDSCALTGSGTLTTVGVPKPTGTASLSGAGALTAAGVPKPALTVPLSGAGALTLPTRTPAIPAAAALSAAGTLTNMPAGVATATAAALSGSGTLTAAGAPSASAAAALSGSGTLTPAGGPAGVDTVASSATGTLAAAGVPQPARTVALTGVGTLTGPAAPAITSAAAALSAVGTLTVDGDPQPTGSASTSGSGTLVTTASAPGAADEADLSGSGGLDIDVVPELTGAADTTAAGSLTADGFQGFTDVAASTSAGTLAGAGHASVAALTTLSAAGTLTGPGKPGIGGAMEVLAGSGSLTITGVPKPARTVALSGAGVLTIGGASAHASTCVLSSVGALHGVPDRTAFKRGGVRLGPRRSPLHLGVDD